MQNRNFDGTINGDVFCVNAQCRSLKEKLTAVHQQVADLSRTVASLECEIRIKDSKMQSLHRDSERLSLELKRQQRCNRNIKQQLEDEKLFHQRERDYFNEEMQRMEKRFTSDTSNTQLHRQRKQLERIRDSLMEENKSLQEELLEKNQTVYNLCIKFLRVKYAKDTIKRKFDQLSQEHLQVMAETMERLDEARRELNIIVSNKFQEPLPLGKVKFLQVLQRNTRLTHENAVLKTQIQQLTLNLEKLRSSAQKPKSVNVDAKIIEKLTEDSRKRRETDQTGKAMSRFGSVNQPEDRKLLKIFRQKSKKSVGTETVRVLDDDLKSEGTCNTTELPPSVLPTEKEERSCGLRDAATNT